MKNIIYRRSDNSFALGMVDPKHLQALMGSGGLVTADRFEREIAVHMMTVENEAEFQADWESFLAARKGSAREVAIRQLLTYARDGGATEEQAYAAIAAKNIPSDCVDYRTVEHDDLPSDTYFQDAWEWSD